VRLSLRFSSRNLATTRGVQHRRRSFLRCERAEAVEGPAIRKWRPWCCHQRSRSRRRSRPTSGPARGGCVGEEARTGGRGAVMVGCSHGRRDDNDAPPTARPAAGAFPSRRRLRPVATDGRAGLAVVIFFCSRGWISLLSFRLGIAWSPMLLRRPARVRQEQSRPEEEQQRLGAG
jgi:hypothetical protein